MIWLLDTNACIGFLSGRTPRVRARLNQTGPWEVGLCAIDKSELLFGAHKSSRPAENLARLDAFFQPLRSLPFDDRAAAHAGQIRALLGLAGTPIGPNDLLIAATALANDVTTVTHNQAEFGRVAGLKLEDWET